MAPSPNKITMKEMKKQKQTSSNADESRAASSTAETNADNGHFNYVSLINRSASFDSSLDAVGLICSDTKIKQSNSDQRLPDCAIIPTSSSESVKEKPKTVHLKPPPGTAGCTVKKQKPIFDGSHLDGRSPLAIDKCEFKVKKIQPAIGRSVPNCSRLPSATSLHTMTNVSLSEGRADGQQLVLNPLNLGYHMELDEDMYEEDAANSSQDLSYSHIKYINMFSIICCWCFPFTGIFSIVYARLAKKYYSHRDQAQAKKYLSKSEWLLILTFFFGLTIIAISLAFLDAYYVKKLFPNNSTTTASSSNDSLQKRPFGYISHVFH